MVMWDLGMQVIGNVALGDVGPRGFGTLGM